MSNNRIIISGSGTLLPEFTLREFDGDYIPVSALSERDEKRIEDLQLENNHYKNIDKTALMAILAARDAAQEALWDDDLDTGVNISSSRGATQTLEKSYSYYKENKNCPVTTSPLTTLGNISSWVLQDQKKKGASLSHSMTCSSALYSIGNALAWLKSGMSNRFLVGGSEAPLTPFTIAQMKALKIYSKYVDSEVPSKPHSVIQKNSFVLGEASVVFAIQAIDDSRSKGKICIEAFGYGSEAIQSPTGITTTGDCFYQSMNSALKNSPNSDVIDLILLHSPGTKKGDSAELQAIQSVFGEEHPYLYSNKCQYGHTLAASGALSIYSALDIFKTGVAPEFPYDSEINDMAILPDDINTIMINAAGFGGVAASVILQRSR